MFLKSIISPPDMNSVHQLSTRVILVGVGGASCSGKTTLVKYLNSILPGSVIVHQDDFSPPQKLIPVHPVYNVQDWDSPPTAILWHELIEFLKQVKQTGVIPPDHHTHDHLNDQTLVTIDEGLQTRWINTFEKLKEIKSNPHENIVWVLMDGFLLYWHPEVIRLLDIRLFIREPEDVLRQRRHERHGYHTAVQIDPEGTLWRDPPNYWEQIVYPAYLDAHREVFIDGDVENGMPGPKVSGLVVLENTDMSGLVDASCRMLQDAWTQGIEHQPAY